MNPSLEDGFGGAIYVTERVASEPVTLDIRNSVFRNNTTNLIDRSSGGALAALNTTVKLTNVLFEGNSSFFGGGASITNAKEGSLLSRVVFDRNTASRQGGALDTFSEGFGFTNKLRVEKTVFTGNKAAIGSAISNEAFAEGEDLGGIVVRIGGGDSELKFKDSLFTNNGPIDPTKTAQAVALVDTSDSGNPITTSEGNNFSDDRNIDFNNPTDKKGVLTGIVLDNATDSNTQLSVPAVTKGWCSARSASCIRSRRHRSSILSKTGIRTPRILRSFPAPAWRSSTACSNSRMTFSSTNWPGSWHCGSR